MSAPRPCPACGGPLAPWRRVPSSDPAAAAGSFHAAALRRCADRRSRVEPAPPRRTRPAPTAAAGPACTRLAAPLLARFDRRRLRLAAPRRPAAGTAARRRRRARAVRAQRGAGGLRRHGHRAVGSRASPARGELGAEVLQASIEHAPRSPTGSLDAVTLWHVLEHLEDPGAALETIARLAAAGRGAARRGAEPGEPPGGASAASAGTTSTSPATGCTSPPTGWPRCWPPTGSASCARRTCSPSTTRSGCGSRWSAGSTRPPSYLYHLLKRNAPLRRGDLLITRARAAAGPARRRARAGGGRGRPRRHGRGARSPGSRAATGAEYD